MRDSWLTSARTRRARVAATLAILLAGVAMIAALGRSFAAGAGARKNAASAQNGISGEIPRDDLFTVFLLFRGKLVDGKRVPTGWDGTVGLSRGRVEKVRTWQTNASCYPTKDGWKLRALRKIPSSKTEKAKGKEEMPVQDTGVLLTLGGVGPDTRVEIETVQGSFSFQLEDVPFGRFGFFLEGLARVSRLPDAATIVSAATHDDYPSAARGPGGELYVAYTAFTPGKDFLLRPPLAEAPEDFEHLENPTGGDRVWLLCLDGDKWSAPLAVTPTGQDVYRTAVAVDGEGEVWVFWSAKVDGKWDLFARALKGKKWSMKLRLTHTDGPDVFPAAATDASGRVWVAWQAFRAGNSDILAARQDGRQFGEPMVVSEDPANEWTPAVATSGNGEVAFVWDTYAKGDYDVYGRVWSDGALDEPFPIASSLRDEKRPSATYDAEGRLWTAYEDSPERWGKDWGAFEKEDGAKLYMNRGVAVRVWEGGRLFEPAGDPNAILRGFQKGTRAPGRGTSANVAAPQLALDESGRVWLAGRSTRMGGRAGVGTTWFTRLAWYDGDQWSGPVSCFNTDGLLDNRPALAPRPGGGMTVVSASDGRQALASRPRRGKVVEETGENGDGNSDAEGADESEAPPAPVEQRPKWVGPINSEIVMAAIRPDFSGPGAAFKLQAVENSKPAAPNPEAAEEAQAITRMRAHRAKVGGKEHRILRGEFHRHTEISGDGGGDGMLMDMWRYALDAADMDWIGNGDHDNGGGKEYSWWIVQKTTDMFQVKDCFTPMFTYERSCSYPDGHRNVVFARRGVRTLPRLKGGKGEDLDDLGPDEPRPNTPDTQMLYRYLRQMDGVCASHTSATDMGTDWRDNDSRVEPIVEIYQGDRHNYEMPGAPRANTAEKTMGGFRPLGFVSLALKKGFRLGFQSSSDHGSTHMSYCNVWVEEPTREAILEAMKRRHIYGSTDNIIAEFRCGDHFMGDEFTLKEKPTFQVRVIGSKPMAKVHIIKDGQYVYSPEFDESEVSFEWTDVDAQPGKTSYYYVRGEQSDGELVWMSPMWIAYEP
jgi:hypothetical protein